MTEDDTFRLLKRTPYDEVYKLVVNAQFSRHPISHYIRQPPIRSDKEILEQHGWTEEEYDAECDKRNPALYKYLRMIKGL